ncbi:MAG: hypothetical protein COZ46_06245 [Verrucomicrobia bacterium CG_4_10_14_3_um_filter_43_23]|nr:MAG: hypothetical protein AUJ82_07960 [Verrucomicrobia bacterium CG1_02_43_26]PIP59370.1 MAG: hypothetical protein COX01_04180 [Verrucomicrobia bacterium CG22_combo_CG10-13_8_21_14_all_43_17]PIX57995.1 MAG: hypothetical protein COZ46_06245 [Verrucomicrobia bacterium CG_4_10_14_3_um_filter_43_23]PIY61284.1 MAG: hypothetical protein COY94_06180 [Verrucomicrobia bacterium CG_4_10_14_0_8_um_filter_43_34]PJA44263.1 MAG: hypothetical protein CO175_03870 [Verrucomicrobia bacterium CG_4_9_14_3_um_fi
MGSESEKVLKLKLLNFNIAHGRGLSLYQGFSSEKRLRKVLYKISDLLKSTGANIVTMQEVDQDSHWNKYLDLLEILQKGADYPYAAHGITNVREAPKRLVYGNALLSHYPIQYWESNPFGEATLGEKGFMYVELAIGKRIIPIVNMHLDFRSRRKRITQIEHFIDFICQQKHPESLNEPIAPIICGDFNSKSKKTNDAVNHLFDHMQKNHADYNLFPVKKYTYPAFLPYKGLDFVFLPKCYKLIDCRVIKTYLSDHLPVLLEFEVE